MSSLNRRELLRRGAHVLVDGSLLVILSPSIARAAAKAAGAQVKGPYGYLVDASRCIGCGACVRACRTENKVPTGQFRTWIERYTLAAGGGVAVDSPAGGERGFDRAAIPGAVEKSYFVPKLCNHCKKPPCVQVCPVGATFATREGVVLVDGEHCVGCGYCLQACPYGGRFKNHETHVADKCTWCYHRVKQGKLPACVGACPVGARLFGDVGDPDSEIAGRLAEKRVSVLKPDLGTEPQVYYEGISKEVR